MPARTPASLNQWRVKYRSFRFHAVRHLSRVFQYTARNRYLIHPNECPAPRQLSLRTTHNSGCYVGIGRASRYVKQAGNPSVNTSPHAEKQPAYPRRKIIGQVISNLLCVFASPGRGLICFIPYLICEERKL